ncbi:hypothetical protein IQ06DRAFT_255913 [Phaeosphaeriaceae sp. SRC1lsM3a]|nr:hypothetical protein IQ06DRAFT_255913 [Stagonospora sp. SRC1lsM3a]
MATTEDFYLPEEILDKICASADPTSLAKLCLASKTLNRIATARLYSHIELNHLGDTAEEVSQIIPLAYLFFRSPAHAALVSSVDVGGPWGRMEEDKDLCDKLSWPKSRTRETENLLKNTCAKFASTDEERDEMYSAIASGTNEDAILAMLLASLPNLRRLDINFGCSEETDEFIWLFEKLCGQEAMTDRLKPVPIDVMVRGDDDKYPHNPAHLATFFHLPNVRSIYAYKMGNEEAEQKEPFMRLKPHTCTVEIIELRTSKLHKDNLKLLVAATIPGKLKTFNYEIGCTWAWCDVDHPAIMESLAIHHDTLENLGLSHEDFYPYQFVGNADITTPCTFIEFTALKRLKVAPVYVWGHEGFTNSASLGRAVSKEVLWQALPRNLEELWITRAEHQAEDSEIRFEPACLLPALDCVVRHKTEAYPKLSHLRVEFPPKNWQTEWLDELASICERARTYGIECTIILTHVERRTQWAERKWGWDEDMEWGHIWQNEEARKHWIVAAVEEDLTQKLRDVKIVADADM